MKNILTQKKEKALCPSCKNTLIIEDDPGIREAFQNVLEFEGYNVFTAPNGKEGFELLTRIPEPCLIFLDIMMPIMNGIEFLKIIQKDKIFSNIPVVIVSAFADRAKEFHVKGIIDKPVDITKVLNVAKEYCNEN